MPRDRSEYDAIDAVSHSRLKDFDDHPQVYYRRYVTKDLPPRPANDAMQWGTDLENRLWGEEPAAVLIPEDVLSKSGSRSGAAWKAFAEEHEGQRLLKKSEYDLLMYSLDRAVANIEAHPQASELILGDGEVWQRLTWTCPDTGLPRKGELDAISKGVLVDLKSCRHTSAEAIARQVVSLGYHRQLAGYQQAIEQQSGKHLPVVLVAVRNDEPYDVAVYELTEQFLELGREANIRSLRQLKQCMETGVWQRPGHSDVILLEPPRWAKYGTEYQFLAEG